jgi:choline dehydrogenase-like flavoprotein
MIQAIETDICIIGSGITAALLAEKLSEERRADIVVVEAGDEMPPLGQRARLRQRLLDYGESPWPHDHLDGYEVEGIQSRSMCVGGLAMHWGAVTPRFTPEDFRIRSLYGVGDDWPISYDDLEPFYHEAEERIGVAGESGPQDADSPRSKPYPQPALPLTYNLELLKPWGERTAPFWSQPSAKNSVVYRGRAACCRNDTCFPICPVGAKYSPDFTWAALRSAGKVHLIPRTLVRRLVLEDRSPRVSHAVAVNRDHPNDTVEFHARTFVVAAGYTWSPHLLLLSTDRRFPNGLANRGGLVGKYMNGHRNVFAFIRLPLRLYPGMNGQHSLMSHRFMRPTTLTKYLRHDLRIWESSLGAEPRLRDENARLLLGDDLLADWRSRTERGTVRLRAYYDVLPHRESSVTLDHSRLSPWGDPLPRISYRDSETSAALRGHTEDTIKQLFRRMATAGGGKVVRDGVDSFQDHPGGGCRMGEDANTGVVNSWGRTFDHENLFVVGAPTTVSPSCCNATLTFVALGLRAATEIGRTLPAAEVH